MLHKDTDKMAATHSQTAVVLLSLFGALLGADRPHSQHHGSLTRVASSRSIGYGLNGVFNEWSEAKTACASWNSKLAFPNSPEEFQDLRGFLQDEDGTTRELLIGFHSKFVQHHYVTIEGLALDSTGYQVWDPTSTNASHERCGVLTVNGLKTVGCTTPMWSVCEYPGVSYERVGDFGLFAFHDQARNWTSAVELCRVEDAYLLVLRGQDEFEALVAHLAERTDADRILYGAHHMFADQLFVTLADETLRESGFELWAPEQPGNVSNAELPLVDLMLGDPSLPEAVFGLTLGQLDNPLPFVCKRELHPNN